MCQECQAHDRECTKQGIVRGSKSDPSTRSVKVQVTRLESAVEKLARENTKLDASTSTEGANVSGAIPTSEDEDVASLTQSISRQSPIFALFNNEIVCISSLHESTVANV